MTNRINQQAIPAYSGITINITSPTLNAAPLSTNCCNHNCPEHQKNPTFTVEQNSIPLSNDNYAQQSVTNPIAQSTRAQALTNHQYSQTQDMSANAITSETQSVDKLNNVSNANSRTDSIKQIETTHTQETLPQAYPPQYYLNNYNYIQNGEKNTPKADNFPVSNNENPTKDYPTEPALNNNQNVTQEEDMTVSKDIINELDTRVAEQKDLEKNGKKTKVVALTNEYIMSLENYLNNPNTEIRLMAAKEVLTRLDEDKERFDDAALNALLNKMLQDPEKLVRIAALSAFSSQLASGNDFTVNLLTKIQNNPNADKEDALQAADSLLKMSSRTEIRYIPVENNHIIQQQVEQ